ncbi:hypothetical protein ACFZB9_22495 [Kitasatospora sp. NPDC008050]|uniref:hypothetical protein n=1 Tax=Kitasatospora sp. NPDC008050 TaxID=3364021 RepID=UPI0036E18A72
MESGRAGGFTNAIAAACLAAAAVLAVGAANAGHGSRHAEAGPHPFIHAVHVSAGVSPANAAGTVWPSVA